MKDAPACQNDANNGGVGKADEPADVEPSLVGKGQVHGVWIHYNTTCENYPSSMYTRKTAARRLSCACQAMAHMHSPPPVICIERKYLMGFLTGVFPAELRKRCLPKESLGQLFSQSVQSTTRV